MCVVILGDGTRCRFSTKTLANLASHVNTSHGNAGVTSVSGTDLASLGLVLCPLCLSAVASLTAHQALGCRANPKTTSAAASTANLTAILQLAAADPHALQLRLTAALDVMDWASIADRITTTCRSRPLSAPAKRALLLLYTVIANMIELPVSSDAGWKLLLLLPAIIFTASPVKIGFKAMTGLIAERLAVLLAGVVFVPPAPVFVATAPSQARNSADLAAQHVVTGQLSKAMQSLAPRAPGVSPDAPTSRDSLAALLITSPPSSTTTAATPPHPVVITNKLMRNTIDSLQRNKAPGPSGLRADVLMDLRAFNIVAPLTRIANCFFNSVLPAPVVVALGSSAGTLLLKPNGSIRPIGVTEVLTRLFAKLALGAESSDIVSSFLLPFQHGVATRDGAATITNTVTLLVAQAPAFITSTFDMSNAFGRVSRAAIRAALVTLNTPVLLRYFDLIYGQVNNMLFRTASPHLFNDGVVQGDPAAPLFFAVALQSVILQCSALLPGGYTAAYLDDITFSGPPEQVTAASSRLSVILASIGLSLNVSKTQSHGHSAATGGVTILGVPIGSPSFVSSALTPIVAEAVACFDLIRSLPSLQHQLLLTRHCIISKLPHLARSVPPSLLRPALDPFNTALHGFLLRLLHHTHLQPASLLAVQQLQQASLPITMGGLGLTDLRACCGPIFLACFIQSITSIQHASQHILPFAAQLAADPASSFLAAELHSLDALMASASAALAPPVVTPRLAYFQVPHKRNLQHDFTDVQHRTTLHTATSFFAELASSTNTANSSLGRFHTIRIQEVSSSGSLSFLQAIPSSRSFVMTNDELIVTIRRVLGIPVAPSILHSTTCQCGHGLLTDSHLESCSIGYLPSLRHNELRDIYALVLRLAGFTSVDTETIITGTQLRYDVTGTSAPQLTPLAYDVVITNPTQVKYMSTSLPPALNKVTGDACDSKLSQYGPYTSLRGPGACFVPLSHSSLGSTHPSSLTHLRNICDPSSTSPPDSCTWAAPTLRSFLEQASSTTIHRGTARIFLTALGLIRSQPRRLTGQAT